MSINRRYSHVHDAASTAEADERRSFCRYAVVQTQAWIGWWEDKEFRHVPADIEDISLRGAKLTVEKLPPNGQPVWFNPPSGAPDEWLEAQVIEAKKRLFGPRQLRIVFRRAFPYEVFKNVVYGPDAVGKTRPKEWLPDGDNQDKRDYW